MSQTPNSAIAVMGIDIGKNSFHVLVRIKDWERYGLKSWIEAAKRRLHHNVLAIALANKLARIAWAVLAKGRAFELTRIDDAGLRPV